MSKYDICGDDRFEVIDAAKAHILEATNISSRPDEMAVLDSFLFRCWQMGWLHKYEKQMERGINESRDKAF